MHQMRLDELQLRSNPRAQDWKEFYLAGQYEDFWAVISMPSTTRTENSLLCIEWLAQIVTLQ